MIHRPFLILALLLSIITGSFGAGSRFGGVELPASPAGRIANEFFKVLNSNDTTSIADFITANFTDDSLKDTPLADRLRFFERLYRQSGGVEPMIISPDSNERFLVVDVKSLRGNHWARMFFVMNRQAPTKLNEIGMFGIRDPIEAKADAWPEIKMSEPRALKEIARHVASNCVADRFSGSVLVAKGDRVLFQKACGMADMEFRVPNRVNTKFNLASMNKMFTAIAIVQLVEAGKLSFDDTLAKLLPEYPNREAAEKIKIRHLLTHTSGLGDFFDNPNFRPFREKYQSPKDYFPLFASRPLYFEPGARFSYSNAGFVVLGAIVEKLSGQSYFEYIRENIYKRAGMTDSDSYELTEVVPNRATGYAHFEDDPMGIDPRRSNIAFLPWKGSPAGGGYSTAPDLLKFVQAFRAGKLVSPDMRDTLIATKTPMTGTPHPGGYGFGFVTSEFSGKKIFGHGGGGANSGIDNEMTVFADGTYTVIVLGNYDPTAAGDLSYEITRLLARI